MTVVTLSCENDTLVFVVQPDLERLTKAIQVAKEHDFEVVFPVRGRLHNPDLGMSVGNDTYMHVLTWQQEAIVWVTADVEGYHYESDAYHLPFDMSDFGEVVRILTDYTGSTDEDVRAWFADVPNPTLVDCLDYYSWWEEREEEDMEE